MSFQEDRHRAPRTKGFRFKIAIFLTFGMKITFVCLDVLVINLHARQALKILQKTGMRAFFLSVGEQV